MDDGTQGKRVVRGAPEHWQARRRALEQELAEPVTLDGLSRDWFIVQRASGHRHSIDDVLTAAYALEVSPPVRRHLDLGTGIGTVGLLVLWGMGGSASMTGIEAQAVSYQLLLSNIAENGLAQRVTPLLGDLRSLNLEERFPLITGSPPYFPIHAGIVPKDSQKAHARFELRGDIRDYAQAAQRHLAAEGWFVVCFPTAQKARAQKAIAAAELSVVRCRDVIPRSGRAPLFSLFACRHRALGSEALSEDPPFVVRDADGALSASMQQVRSRFGFER